MTPATPDARVHAALASPVRTRVLDLLAASPDALTAQQLATSLDLHVTTVRFHVDQLETAGMVERETRRRPGRGRPSIHFRLVETAPDPDLDQARDEMIGALAQALAAPEGQTRTDAARTAGRRWADRLPDPATTTLPTLTEAFTRLGFDPQVDGSRIMLRACPFRAAARENPQIVCQVHLGLAERLVARSAQADAPQIALRPFVEPDLCVVDLLQPPPTEGAR